MCLFLAKNEILWKIFFHIFFRIDRGRAMHIFLFGQICSIANSNGSREICVTVI